MFTIIQEGSMTDEIGDGDVIAFRDTNADSRQPTLALLTYSPIAELGVALLAVYKVPEQVFLFQFLNYAHLQGKS
jgi:hypothetical protein